MHSYGGDLVPRGLKLALLKSLINAENFIHSVQNSPLSLFTVIRSFAAINVSHLYRSVQFSSLDPSTFYYTCTNLLTLQPNWLD